MPPAPVHLDGAQGEGGGQILRTALFLSVLLDRPFRMERIRAGRSEPGLKAQHLAILKILESVTGARVEGARIGAPAIAFEPSPPRPGDYAYDVGTAGSIPLILQTMLPVALLSVRPFGLHLTGGTDVPWGPTIDWVDEVLLPRVRGLASKVEVVVERRGFYPRGGGLVELEVEGGPGVDGLRARVGKVLAGDRTKRGSIVSVGGRSLAQESLRSARVAERQADAARAVLEKAGWPSADFLVQYVSSASVGSSLTLWAQDGPGNRLGADGLGSQGVRAEDVGRDAAKRLLEDWETGATVDRHLADHLVPWIALGAGAVRVPSVTEHLATNVAVCKAFMGEESVHIDANAPRGEARRMSGGRPTSK